MIVTLRLLGFDYLQVIFCHHYDLLRMQYKKYGLLLYSVQRLQVTNSRVHLGWEKGPIGVL